MPGSQTSPMNRKTRFIADYLRNRFGTRKLSGLYRMNRKRGYKWMSLRSAAGCEATPTAAMDSRAISRLTMLRIRGHVFGGQTHDYDHQQERSKGNRDLSLITLNRKLAGSCGALSSS
jgi:hypothetical protein